MIMIMKLVSVCVHLTFKLSFEPFDFNDEEFLNDLKRVYHYYDNFVVLEYKGIKQKILKELESLDDTKNTLMNIIFNLVI